MTGKEKILANSISGILMLEICWYGSHGICMFNHSHILPTARRYADEETRKIANGKTINFRHSWREHLQSVNADLAKNYHKFNLTESGVIAYIRLDDYVHEMYNKPFVLAKMGIETLSKKHLAKHLLTMWIENEGVKVGLNE